MPLITTPAIVLNRFRFGETERLVTFFTSARGKLKGVARGGAKLMNRYGAALEPFTHCRIVLYEKRPTILLRVRQADILDPFSELKSDLDRLSAGSRILRMVQALSPEGEANPPLFEWMIWLIGRLSDQPPAAVPILRTIGELRILKHTGFQPRTDFCLRCRRPHSGTAYFLPKSGGLVCSSCAAENERDHPMSPAARVFAEQALAWQEVALLRLRPSPADLGRLQAMVRHHAAYILGHPSRQKAELSADPTQGLDREGEILASVRGHDREA
jgi:DNA repair protein RecO (recombination protein O)